MGLILGALFGGRGGLFFVVFGFFGGCAVGVIRTVYLGLYYDESPESRPASTRRIGCTTNSFWCHVFFSSISFSWQVSGPI